MQHCSVSIDLDPLGCYYGIHGLGRPPAALADVVLRRGLPRFAELFARRGIHATFFVVAEDLDADAPGSARSRAQLGELARGGHELGNHSHHHPYHLIRMSRDAMRAEVAVAHARITACSGVAPVGFRSPGYNVSATLLDVVAELGYQYDSSILPSPGYYSAKAMVMGAMRLGGRTSASVLGDPRQTLAPIDPYRPDPSVPWRRGQGPLVELPITVTSVARLWVIGTTLMGAPDWVRVRLLEAVRGRPFVNLELHGIDLVDAELDGIPAELVARQPDLRIPLARKQRALEATLDRLALDFTFAPLRDVATRMHRDGVV